MTETSRRTLPSRAELVELAEPIVQRYGSKSGWNGEATCLTNVHAAGVTGWLNRHILPEPKSFTCANDEVNLGQIMDQVYSAC